MTSTTKSQWLHKDKYLFPALEKSSAGLGASQGSHLLWSDSVIWCDFHLNICFYLHCNRERIADELDYHQAHWSQLVSWTSPLQRRDGKYSASREERRTQTFSEVIFASPPHTFAKNFSRNKPMRDKSLSVITILEWRNQGKFAQLWWTGVGKKNE